MAAGSDEYLSLPPHYAFVVQLATDTQVESGRIHGRVEHVVSRHATHFASLETLLVFIARVLRDIVTQEQAPEARTPPAPYGGSVLPDAGNIC